MSVIDVPPPPVPGGDRPERRPSRQEAAWDRAAAATVAAMGAVNPAVAGVVDAVAELIATDGWEGAGIRSPEHWLSWHAAMSASRARGLVAVARRLDDLPGCAALFRAGRLGEDAMVRIARRVPAERDSEVAALAPKLMISQLDRVLAALPELADGSIAPARPEPERKVETGTGRDGWMWGRFCLPPDEGALFDTAISAGFDAEFRDRHGLDPDAEVTDPRTPDGEGRRVSLADAFVRLAAAGLDALDSTLQRTGSPSERHQIVVHADLGCDGTLGPGQVEHGPVLPDWLTAMVGCDAKWLVAVREHGRLVGFKPSDRRPNRSMRRYLARRDQGCTHPLCRQTRWLHAHHLVFWDYGGRTTADNLVLLCPHHHRALHRREFTIEGDPEAGTLRFLDRWGNPIAPPEPDPPGRPPPDPPPPGMFDSPSGERLTADTFTWN